MAMINGLAAVVFDIGNVLYRWDIRALYAKLIPDPARLDWFCREVVTPAWHFQHDAGRSHRETVPELIAQFPEERDLIEAYAPRWLETIPGPVEGMLELVEELAARSVPLYAITNFSAEFWGMFRPTAPVFDHFRDVIVSGAERMMKPDPAIYELAVARFGHPAGTMLFIDDRHENVAAAEACGFQAMLFEDAPRLRNALLS